MKILVFLLHLITRVKTRKLGLVDLALIFEETTYIEPYNFDNFQDMMNLAFDTETANVINIYTICDGSGWSGNRWGRCGGGFGTSFNKRLDVSLAKVNKDFFGTTSDRSNVPNMLFRTSIAC